MRPTWPSIIPLGATTRAPARAWASAALAYIVERGVVVDAAALVEHAAVAVVGVLVDAQVGDQHDVVADVAAQVGERQLDDAVGVVGAAAERRPCAPARRTGSTALTPRAASSATSLRRLSRVCCTTPGSDAIGTGSVDALADEQRGDEVGGAHGGLGDEVTQRHRRAQAARSRDWELGHRRHRTATQLAALRLRRLISS